MSGPSFGEIQGTRVDEAGRTIYLFGEIDEEIARFLVQALLFFEDFDTNEPIRLFINSTGGSLGDAFGVYDCIRSLRVPVHTYAIADVSSAATVLLLAGEKRFAYPHAQVFLHAVGKVEVSGSVVFLETIAQELRWYAERWAALVTRELRSQERCAFPVNLFEIVLGLEPPGWVLGGDELVRQGWVDEVVQPAHRLAAGTPDAGVAGAPDPDRMGPLR